jgi:hypothetical protein
VPEKPESRIKRAFFKLFGQTFKLSWAEKIQQVVIRGTPDILACVPCSVCKRGLFLGMELKIPGEKPDPLQESKGRRIRSAGGLFLAYRSSADMAVVEEWGKGVPLLEHEDLLKLTEVYLRGKEAEQVRELLVSIALQAVSNGENTRERV